MKVRIWASCGKLSLNDMSGDTLTGLNALLDDLRDLALELLLCLPLNEIFAVSLYTSSLAQSVPITTIVVDVQETT